MPWSARAASCLVALLYLGIALWAVRVVLPAPASTLPYPLRVDELAPRWARFTQSDEKLAVATTTYNARMLVTDPAGLVDGPQCHPLPDALALGEHMIGLGLRALPIRLLTSDPILTYNLVLLVTLWLAAFGMYLLVRVWTGSVGAAVVAGILFGFYQGRIVDTAHPFVAGNHWTPFVFLCAHRLCTRGRWRDALGLTLFTGLQILEGAYPMLALALMGAVYGPYLLVRHRGRLRELAPKLSLTAAVTGCVAAAVLLPYARMRATWGTLSREGTLLYDLTDFGWGHVAYPGSVLFVLALAALGDRVRGARTSAGGDDPRLIYAVIGITVLWAAVQDVVIPVAGIRLPSLFTLAAPLVPGLDSVRVFRAVASGVLLAGAFLAGYGAWLLGVRLGPRGRVILTSGLCAAALLEAFWPPLARMSFGSSTALRAYGARPAPGLLALYQRTAPGPLLDLPLESGRGGAWYMGEHVLLGAYHEQRIGSCYNSFRTPVQDEIEALAARVHQDPRAGAALYALGFRNIVVHALIPGRRRPPPLVPRPLPPHLVEVGSAGGRALYHLRSDAPVEASLAPLVGGTGRPALTRAVVGPAAAVTVTFRNATSSTYRHPDPIRPTALVIRWYDGAGIEVATERLSALLPLALAAGEEATRLVVLSVPSTVGAYRVAVAPAATPELVIGDALVEVAGARP